MENQIKFLIENYSSNDQRTEAWHAKRSEMLTASEIHKALKDATPAAKHEIIMSKLVPRPRTEGMGSRALLWGTRFEPIAKEIYSEKNGGISIVDTTCIPHPVYPFLGASPDGIIVTADVEDFRYGKLVEFKCPISRVFSDTTPVPHEYFCQMQLQMECTSLKECEYIEFGFRDLNYSAWMDSTAEYKSAFVVHMDTGEVVYRDFHDTRPIQNWLAEIPDRENWNTQYWDLSKWRAVTVPHDKDWLSTNIDSMKEVWEEVRKHREANTVPEHPKEKATLTIVL